MEKVTTAQRPQRSESPAIQAFIATYLQWLQSIQQRNALQVTSVMKALNRQLLQMELRVRLAPRVISACKAPQHLSHVTLAHTERLWELQLLLIAQPVPQMSNVIKEAFINIQLKLSSVLLEITVLMPPLLRSVTEVTIVLPMSKHRSSVPMASSNTMNSSQSALNAQKTRGY